MSYVYVSHSGSNTAPYDLWSKATSDLAAAVAVANASAWNMVVIDDGTYNIFETVTLAYGTTIYSRNFDKAKVVIAGDNTFQCFYINDQASVNSVTIANGSISGNGGGAIVAYGGSVNDCRITGCSATGPSGYGGGVYSVGPYAAWGCTIDNCTATAGGGCYVASGDIEYCTVNNCTSSGSGGGAYIASGSTIGCTISNCSSTVGGGIFMSSGSVSGSMINYCTSSGGGGGIYVTAGTINSCTIDHCSSGGAGVGATGDYGGGGACIYSGSIYGSTVSNCSTVISASRGYGGGVLLRTTTCTASHCTLIGNTGYYGGGTSGYLGYGKVDNCLMYGNSARTGGGTYMCTVINCTICDNNALSYGGIYSSNARNSIAYFNSPGANISGTPDYCCTPEGSGTNAIMADPSFVNRGNHNYRINDESPCINAGNESYISGLDGYDLDQATRVVGGRVDVGAYENQGEEESSSSSQNSSSSSSSKSSGSSQSSLSSSSQSKSSASSLNSSSSSSSPSSLSSRSSSSFSSSSSQSSSSSPYERVIFQAAGISYSSPSLVIDVLNTDELVGETKSAFGDSFSVQLGWVSEERLRGDLSRGMAQWGFKQANGKSSNAVVFSGEKVVLKFVTKGHGVGYATNASDGAVFSHTIVRVTLQDLMRGVEKSITFDGFSKPDDDPSRFFLWEVSPTDAWVTGSRNSNNVCGMFLLRVSEESILFRNADWTFPVALEPMQGILHNETSLQVTAYDWRDALGSIQLIPSKNVAVMSGVEFRTSAIDNNTTSGEDLVFDGQTNFPAFEPSAGLNQEQKTVVIRDNAMVLLASQGPILPADAAKASVLGVGMVDAVLPNGKGPVVSVRPASAVPMVPEKSRAFSLTGRPAATNVLDDLDAMASEHDQGYFGFSDPIRMLSFGLDGSPSQELDGGMAWVLSGNESTGMRMTNGKKTVASVVIGDYGREIDIFGAYDTSSSSERFTSSSSSSLSSISSGSSSSISSPSSGSSQSSNSRSSHSSRSSRSSRSSQSSGSSQSSVSSQSSSSSSFSSISSQSSSSNSSSSSDSSSSSSIVKEFTYILDSPVVGEVTITKYLGSAANLVIPATILGRTVTLLQNNVAYSSIITTPASLTSVTIPYGVKIIGSHAFHGCYKIISIIIPSSVTTIGQYAFSTAFDHGNMNLVIPDSVVSIEDAAFAYSALGSVVIGDGVTTIGTGAFVGCSFLSSVTLGNHISVIGETAFSATGITSITIPNNVTTLGLSAFAGNGSLRSVVIGNGVNNWPTGYPSSYNNGAFQDCRLLDSVTLTPGLVSTGDSTFRGCSSLTSITLPESLLVIGDLAFADSGLTSITIPNGVTTIGSGAFACQNLLSAVIGSGVTTWGTTYGGAFEPVLANQIIGLKTVTFVPGLKTIGVRAFTWCTSLGPSISFPDSIEVIGSLAFNNNNYYYHNHDTPPPSLNAAYFQGNSPSLGEAAFYDEAAGFTAYYRHGATGFTAPWGEAWDNGGYPTEEWVGPPY